MGWMQPGPIVVVFPNDHAHLPANYPANHEPSIQDTLTQCDQCHVDCWISPEGKQKIRQLGAAKLCVACVDEIMKAHPTELDFEVLSRPKGTPLRRRR